MSNESGPGPAAALGASGDALARRLLDEEFMLEVFRRELPDASAVPLRVTSCGIKTAKTVPSRKTVLAGRTELVYRVEVELADGSTHTAVLCGFAPLEPGFPGPELERRARALRDHPAAAPFRRFALRVEALSLGLLVFPLDAELPALAELTGPGAPLALAPHLAECRAGARLARVSHELRHYKPGERAVLRLRAEFAGAAAPRAVYAKLFSDEHGAQRYGELCALQAAARGARWLRVPEPLGYDAARRVLYTAEVPGGRALAEWIHCVENGEPLPAGVDRGRVERCLLATARALAELQHSGVRPSITRAYRDVLASLGKDRELLRSDARGQPPELVERAFALVARLETLAPEQEPLVPSHGGARHKQTVGDENTLAFVDWDGFCLANPALDPATFLARLQLEPLLDPARGSEMSDLARLFRAEFLACSAAAAQHLELYEGLVLGTQALRALRKPGSTRAAAEPLLAAAEKHLARASVPFLAR